MKKQQRDRKLDQNREPVNPWWYMLGILILALAAIWLIRMNDRAFTDQEAYQICNETVMRYKTMVASKPTDEQWKSFEEEVLPELSAVASDYDIHHAEVTGSGKLLQQLAGSNIPELIKMRGRNSKQAQMGVDQTLLSLELGFKTPRSPEVRPRKPRKTKPFYADWDPVVVGILGFDVVLVAVGLWYRFRR